MKICKNFCIKEPNITIEVLIMYNMESKTLLVYAITKEIPALEILGAFQYFPLNIFLQRIMAGNEH